MNILFLRYSLLNRGGDRMVIEYANALAESGHKVTILLSRDETVFSVSPKIQRQKVSLPGPAGFLASISLRRWEYDAVIVDIIHLTPLVRCTNSLVYFAQADDVEYYDNPFLRRLMDSLYRRFFKRKGKCITVSSRLTEVFAERYGVAKCETVTNGIDLKMFHPEPDPGLVAAKEGRKAIFFMVRGDRFRKGIDIGLELLQRIDKEPILNGLVEVWIGGDPLDIEFLTLPVRNFGVVSDDRLRQILSSADLFLYPSRHEGFGLFPLEAMACGCAVITTDAVPYARNFKVISTAPIEDIEALKGIVDNLIFSQGLSGLREQGKAVAAEYDIEFCKQAFEDALEKLLQVDTRRADNV